MIFVDTHSHIFFKDYDNDRGEVVSRAQQAGVAAVFDVGLDEPTNKQVIANSEKYPLVFSIVGFHPHEAAKYDHPAFADFLEEYKGRYIGVGEFGLDYFRDIAPRKKQRDSFEKQLELCAARELPLIFHCREAEADMAAMIRAHAPLKGVMHCFSGDIDFLKQTLDLGLSISVGGPATYNNSSRLQSVLKAVPSERLLLETDCPFLAPQRHRGKRNEPSYIPLIAEKIAEIRGESVESIADCSTRNAINLFGGAVAEFLESKIGATDAEASSG